MSKIKPQLSEYIKKRDFIKPPTMYEYSAYCVGWEDCKKEVLKILQQEWTGLDMSPNSCDSWYIDKVKEL